MAATQDGEFESSCMCAICMEELGTSIESCPCGHVYHKSCIREWINQKRVCPQCKGVALPLIPLHFNLFHISRDEKKLTTAERVGSIKNDLTAVTMDIETELTEINILEPQLAEGRAEQAAYTNGVSARERRKRSLEAQLEPVRFRQFEMEKKRKQLNEEHESLREKLSKLHLDLHSESSTTRRPIQAKDVSKLIVFMQADVRRLKEIESESEILSVTLADGRHKLGEINSRIRDLAEGSSSATDFVKNSTKNIGGRVDGFVPIDSMGHKRRREEDRLRETENRKPNIFSGQTSTPNQMESCKDIDHLAVIVSFLSDNDDVPDSPIADAPRVSWSVPECQAKPSQTLDAFFNSNVLVLE